MIRIHFVVIFIIEVFTKKVYSLQTLRVSLPGVKPLQDDDYICTAIKLNPIQEYYLESFEAHANMEVAHHMLLYGCQEPGSMDEFWHCGQNMPESDSYAISNFPVCNHDQKIIYAWARNASKLVLPKDVAFRVGGESPVSYLVLQSHYAHADRFKSSRSKGDTSEIEIMYDTILKPKEAGVFLLSSGGQIPPGTTTYMDIACQFTLRIPIVPFAFRTHTHSLGREVSGYIVRRDNKYKDEKWTLIGKKNPMEPQTFYPVESEEPLVIKHGDTLAARCTMFSNRTTVTVAGHRHTDEMCNFYIMYWIESNSENREEIQNGITRCLSPGPPHYSWNNSFKNIPRGTL